MEHTKLNLKYLRCHNSTKMTARYILTFHYNMVEIEKMRPSAVNRCMQIMPLSLSVDYIWEISLQTNLSKHHPVLLPLLPKRPALGQTVCKGNFYCPIKWVVFQLQEQSSSPPPAETCRAVSDPWSWNLRL